MTNKDNIAYSHADIRHYHEGKMSPVEMHALEAAALNDPFLTDAMEGYANAENADAELAGLRTTLQERLKGEEKKNRFRIAFSSKQLLRAAAIFVFLAGAGWLAFHLPYSGNNNIALESTTSKEPIKPADNSTADSITVTSTVSTEAEQELKKAPLVVQAPKPKKRNVTARKKPTQENKEIALETFSNPLSGKVNGLKTDSTAAASSSAFLQPQTFQGKVVDNKGKPVPFASISDRKAKESVRSDGNGNFALRVPDSSATVTVDAIGYQSNRALLNSAMQNEVVLNRDSAALEEVVVTRTQPRRKTTAPMLVQEGQLEPKEGWTRYNDYLQESLNEPEKLEERPASGEVALSFEVNKDGEPINIKVEKSLCESCDQKAIKLLKEGPKWKPRKGKRGSIVIRF